MPLVTCKKTFIKQITINKINNDNYNKSHSTATINNLEVSVNYVLLMTVMHSRQNLQTIAIKKKNITCN